MNEIKTFEMIKTVIKKKIMKAKKVIYSRLASKGNFENVKIEIELEIGENETAGEVFEAAKKWVEKRIAVEKMSNYIVEKAKEVIADKRHHTIAEIEEATEIMDKLKIDDELPF